MTPKAPTGIEPVHTTVRLFAGDSENPSDGLLRFRADSSGGGR